MSKWTPASINPEKDGKYLVTWKGGELSGIDILRFAKDLYKVDKGVAGWYGYNYDYNSQLRCCPVDNVIAWMELPEPYEEEHDN